MPRLVEDTAVIDALVSFQPNWSREVLRSVINKVPTADAEPVQHGHWIYLFATMDGELCFKCSVCGKQEFVQDDKVMESMPHCRCGAKMDEEVTYE